jgi:hypothetical protein
MLLSMAHEPREQRQVFSSGEPGRAHFVQGLLESEGIRTELRNENLVGTAGGEVPVTPDCWPSVWVLSSEAGRAAQIIRDFEASGEPSGESWTCPKCGERLEPQFGECWSCGTTRVIDSDG